MRIWALKNKGMLYKQPNSVQEKSVIFFTIDGMNWWCKKISTGKESVVFLEERQTIDLKGWKIE